MADQTAIVPDGSEVGRAGIMTENVPEQKSLGPYEVGYGAEDLDIIGNLEVVVFSLVAECDNDLQVLERKEAAVRHASRALEQAESGVDTF